MPVSIDEFKGKPDGSVSPSDRVRLASMGFVEMASMGTSSISIDEFKGKPDGTFTAGERIRWACFGFYEAPGVVLTAPICYDAMGNFTDLLQVTDRLGGGGKSE